MREVIVIGFSAGAEARMPPERRERALVAGCLGAGRNASAGETDHGLGEIGRRIVAGEEATDRGQNPAKYRR
jgi:hypothetical protein